MDHFLFTLFHMSIEAGIVTGIVLALRVLFRHMDLPGKYSLFLWIFPFFCMLCPWKLESPIAVIPSGLTGGYHAENIQENMPETTAADGYEPTVDSEEGIPAGTSDYLVNDKENNIQQETYSAGNEKIAPGQKIGAFSIFILWLTGFTGVCLYGIFSCLALRKKLICSVWTDRNIYLADDVEAPFVFGVIRPKIYLPSGLSEEQRMFVLAHERIHIKRKDYVWKACAFILAGVHWFNPFAWAAFILFANDLELACDEAAVKSLEKEWKDQEFWRCSRETKLAEISRRYAQTIVELSAGRGKNAGFPIAFGKENIKRRIQNVMKNRKPVFGAAAAAVFVIVILAAAVILRNRETENEPAKEIITYDPEDGSITQAMSEAPQHTKELNEGKTQEIVITGAVVSEEMPIGADGTSLDYADSEKVIFHDYYGLFVYSLKEDKMKSSVSLKDIGCGYTQGDRACQLFVEENGTEIYLHPMDRDDMFRYDTEKNRLVKEDYSEESFLELQKQSFQKLKDINDCIGPDGGGFRSRYCVALEDDSFLYLESESGMAKDLCYVIGKKDKEEKKGNLFSSVDAESWENSAISVRKDGFTIVRKKEEDGILQKFSEGDVPEATTTDVVEMAVEEGDEKYEKEYEKELEEENHRLFEEYKKYGITKEGDALYYNGQRVSVFYDGYLITDEDLNSVSTICRYRHYDEEGSVKVRAVRLDTVNPDGTVTLFGDLADIVPCSAEMGEIVENLIISTP